MCNIKTLYYSKWIIIKQKDFAMAFDTRYIAAYNIEDVLLNKDTGQPLTAGKVYFEVFNQPGIPKPVWQVTYSSGIYTYTELPNPMILSSIGTFEDALENPVIPYFYPYDGEGDIQYYRVRVLSSGDVEQFVRDPVPSVPGNSDDTAASAFDNELSNTQFAEVLFDTSTASYTYTFSSPVVSQVITIAPDWDMVVTVPVSGSVTLTQEKPAGSLNIPTNPGTMLTISSAGVTALILRQRLYGIPNLWGNSSVDGNGAIAATFLAKVAGGTSATLLLRYSQSNGSITHQTIVNATLPGSGEYDVYPGGIALLASNSTHAFPDAYVDIFFEIPISRVVTLSSVMVTGTGPTVINDLIYNQESENRQIDHLFHYYKPQLEFMPISSLLTGWDFPLNPAQALGATVTMTTTPAYIWDQTISQSVVGNIAVIRNAVTGGFQATTANALEAFYVMQYLSSFQAKKILDNPLSVNINAFRTQAGGVVTARVYLYRGSAAAVFPTLPLTIGGATPLNAGGVFTVNTTAGQGLNWTLIARGNLGQAAGDLSTVDTATYSTLNDIEDLKFSGWQITDSTQISDTDKFAIVVTFQCPTTATVVVIESVSVVPGEIPTRPAPQTLDQVLSECQYYYQKSFPPEVVPAAPVTNGLNYASQGFQIVAGGGASGIVVDFQTQMRAVPTVATFSPVAATSRIYQFTNTPVATDWPDTTLSLTTINGFSLRGNAPGNNGSGIAINWTANARLGIV